ncbi:Disulfide bond formation protein, DsbB family [Sulfitobacter noctilucicola]|uniref:Disulfide bond formation protein DsbB n=1 Tax=Sulfitobacter noctilucicola TaxID=1342301 RepID=A0A7W6MBG1_9RHOB|nr:disulfide bond formation protein B [Sulfitobacter noctilucicola]KIN66441.1 Disulfide bond formation protein, DsbB family [Sulfitobacter noctilucicola]MBB4175786.1 disulfide bond formation protein DsbB [Sulfitobacter noctilucicola]
MSRNVLIALATIGSAALLLGAFGFQHLGGLPPCKLCLWQRWPHAAAILIGVVALRVSYRGLALLGAAATATTGVIGVYHAGVEWGWWPGPTSCSGGGTDLGSMTGGDLLALDTPTGVVMCDEIVWQLFGLSMAGWNAVIAFGLTVIWIMAALRD